MLSAGRTVGWIVSLAALVAVGCDSAEDAGGDVAAIRIQAGDGISGVDQLRVVVKRESADLSDGGADGLVARRVVDRTVNIGDGLAKPFRVPSSLLPEGEGRVYVHAVALAGGEVLGVADGSAGNGSGAYLLTVRAFDPTCDRDGDTYLDCDNLRAECCASIAADDRDGLSDCLDDPAGVPMVSGDLKRRDASQASPFAEPERADDYATCGNGLDDDCARGDLPCGDVDGDNDGDPVGVDCDDADPDRGPSSYDIPGDGIDQDCDGMDGQGTAEDRDGYKADDPVAGLRDCDDTDPEIHPRAGDIACDGIDQDCSGEDLCAGEGVEDTDGDGIADADDCDPYDAAAFPGGVERCGDGVDQDCDGTDPPCPEGDGDKDGHAGDGDCDDEDPNAYPGAPEKCGDGIDQDCDGEDPNCPEGGDEDGDGFLPPDDCDDDDRSRNPFAPERCDRVDNDCDGLVDEGNPRLHPDGMTEEPETCGQCAPGPNVCSAGEFVCFAQVPQPEVCNGLDDDCDGTIDNRPEDGLMMDEGAPCGPIDGTGACEPGRLLCRDGILDFCEGAIDPAPETCNGVDDDCDGQIDEGEVGGPLVEACFDAEEGRGMGECRDGIRECAMSVEGEGAAFGACRGQVLPAEEVCDGLDNDCNGEVDELEVPCYTHEEGVVVGENGELIPRGTCRAGVRHCDGEDLGACEGEVGPVPELCDGLDNDCDNRVDQFTERCFGGGALDPALINVGICRAGSRVCVDAQFGNCVGEILPTDEACNGQDDDCDGTVDEDFDRQSDPLNCGVCGRRCAAGQACCSGACRRIDDERNCGGCGVVCDGSSDRCVVAQDGESAACQCGDGPACEDRPIGEGRSLVCSNGACVCEDDGDCADDELCCGGECQPTGDDTQCAACGDGGCDAERASACENRECVCGETGQCPEATVCTDTGNGFRCTGCRDNRQCPGNAMCCNQVCVATNAEQRCEVCDASCNLDIADFCYGEENARERSCVCGNGAGAGPCPFFGDDSPDSRYCLREGLAPGEGRCVECRGQDADCPRLVDDQGVALPERDQKPECVDYACESCDPVDHAHCGANELCCGLRCLPTGPGANQRCEGCNAAPCDQDSTDSCTNRSCRCGNQAPCSGGTPFCLDGANRCVECRTDVDCGGHPNGAQCVNFECKACDPANHDGCGANQLCCGAEPSCRATNPTPGGQCEACGDACDALTTNSCTGRHCRCGNNPPCSGLLTGVCRDDNGTCVECTTDAHCNGDGHEGNQCVNNRCRPCDPADHAGCGANQLCCASEGSFRCEGTQGGAAGQCEACDSACGTRSDVCTGRVCKCGAGQACSPNGAEPYCVAGSCDECRNNGDCAANELCCDGACEATGPGANQQCAACGVACDQESTDTCTNRVCGCGGGAECAGNTPVCDDAGNRCVQCLGNGDCSVPTGQCVGNICEECNPVNHDGCNENGDRPICEGGDCRACANDGECVGRPGVRDECVAGRCRRCDPNGNAGCPAALPVCDAGNFSCRACANDMECPGDSQCVGGRCEGCDPADDSPCAGAAPICGDNNECRGCANDAECANKDPANGQCLPDGRCAPCDPANHAGCGANQLCCNLQCQATNPGTQCEVCGVACGDNSADSCVSRVCRCGGNPECEGQTAFCGDGQCVNCRDDGDCGGVRTQCVADQCERCDPADDAGCAANGGTPVCDGQSLSCRACGADGECADNANGTQCVADGECERCDTVDDAGCDANGRRPICAGNPEDCRACINNGECAGNPSGNVCVQSGPISGSCRACDPQDNEGCNPNGSNPVCNAGTGVCRGCQADAECVGNANGTQCVAGRCRPCDPNNNAGCDQGSTAPICVGLGGNEYECQACSGDNQCAGNPNGAACAEAGAEAGSCQDCDPADDFGCNPDGGSPVCGDDYACRACGANGECAANQNGDFCINGACEACNPVDDNGCNANGASPICRGVPLDCRSCNDDAQCAGNPNGTVCTALGCRVCDPADAAGCDEGGNSPVCDGDPPACRGCANNDECVDNANGDECVNGACEECNPNNDAGCDPAGNTPICGGNPPSCQACASDAECLGKPNGNRCVNGSCVACVDAASCQGHPEGNLCLDSNCVSCDADDANCAGHPVGNICDVDNCIACQNGGDCAQHAAGNNCVDGNCGP